MQTALNRLRDARFAFLFAGALLACTATDRIGDAGASGANDGIGSGRSGSIGDGSADASMLSCEDRAQRASRAVQDAFEAADLSCSQASDCEIVSNDTDCHAACGALVSSVGKSAVQAVIAAQNAGICAGYETDGCQRLIPPCIPPAAIGCVAGRCAWLDGVQADAGSQDSGAPNDGCLDRAVSWGPNGGRVAFQDRFTLTPCRTFAQERMGLGNPSSSGSCRNEVATDAVVSLDDLNVALAHADVQAAIADAPLLFGLDSRPVDGTVLRIEFGGAMIDVGAACMGQALCTPIPAGVAALQTVLEQLQAQQRAVPDCDKLP